ncbi:MAG: hypothetical protein JNK49_11310 [Planctomycetes bacterium]|nr:hypothetical protein [Planctomycetota bacterium]
MSLTSLTSLQRQLLEWAQDPANEQFLCHNQEQQLADSLGDPLRRPQVHVAAWLLGTWHLGQGLAQVLGGNGRGFDAVRTGQALRRCSLLLRVQHQQPLRRTGQRAQPFSLQQGALTALFGLALHDPGAEPLYDLLRHLADNVFGPTDHLPRFVRELLALRAGARPVVTTHLGPYQDALLHWHGEGRLFAQDLAALLDLHVQEAQAKGGAFADPPSQCFPLEVLAVAAVRQWCELPMPKVEHPLMFTNLVTMAPTGPWPRPELVQRLERLLRT